MKNLQNQLSFFYSTLKTAHLVSTTTNLLSWDRSTALKPIGQNFRAEQMAYMAKEHHQLMTGSKFVDTVNSLLENTDKLTEDDKINVVRCNHDLQRELKLSLNFVEYEAKTFAQSESVWEQTKEAGDFNTVKKYLEEGIRISKEKAQILGSIGHPYNALLDLYEEGFTVEEVDHILMPLSEKISELIPQIIEKQKGFNRFDSAKIKLNKEKQARVIQYIAIKVGFNGIIAESSHPFSTSLGACDQRITVRYNEEDLTFAVSNGLHEMGHAIYTQGLNKEHEGTPLGWACSLGIHESQSRFWEKIIGTNKPFQVFLSNALKDYYSTTEKVPSLHILYQTQNQVRQSPIRIYADEVTYNLHIIIRYILEKSLISGDLQVKDLPTAWNDLYKKYLDVVPKNDKEGVLQDVHWYCGLIGYFPTYIFGNIYSVCIYEKMREQIKDFDLLVEKGEFSEISNWLRVNIHCHGKRYLGKELIERVAGDVDPARFVSYLRAKFL